MSERANFPSEGGFDGERYAARIAAIAATGKDMHGEARFCASLVPAGARILDAGCGTGRVAAQLAELGYDVTGVDLDDSMLAVARRTPGVRWEVADLTALDLGPGSESEPFDLVVAAGNVFPFLAPGTGPHVVDRLAAHLRPGGFLVAGFGLTYADLPAAAAIVPLTDYDAWCADAGLQLVSRDATWEGDPYAGGSYAVSVHRLMAG